MDERFEVARYIDMAPDDEEWARRAVAPYAAMTPEERLRALSVLNAWMDTLLAGRPPKRGDGELPFALHWRDPSLGRPR